MRIHILSIREYRAHCFTYPVSVFSRALQQAGLDVKLFYSHEAPDLTDCDVLYIVSDYMTDPSTIEKHTGFDGTVDDSIRRDFRLSVMPGLREKAPCIVWADNSATMGKFHRDVFPYVDAYAKKQMLADLALYRQPLYRNDYYLDYYYRNHTSELAELGDISEIEKTLEQEPPFNDEEIHKLVLSWNLSMSDFNSLNLLDGKGRRFYRLHWPMPQYRKPYAAPNAERPMDISCRISVWRKASNQHVGYVRKQTADRVRALSEQSDYTVGQDGRLKFRDYINEMCSARITMSPFGYGEVCWRDFEIFLCGSLMFKGNMDHIQTWPRTLYKDGETYVSHKWDFSDFDEKLAYYLEHPAEAREIAQEGQAAYLAATLDGEAAFVQHFQDLTKQALERQSVST